LLTPK